MKRFVVILAIVSSAGVARAQFTDGPAQPPSQSAIYSDNHHCTPVRAGDTVTFELTIDKVANAKSVFAELQMRPGRHAHYQMTDLPSPDLQSLNGGSAATADGGNGHVYHFSFKVPEGTAPGLYHGVGVAVTVSDDGSTTGATRTADVTRHTEEQIRSYCVAVFSGHGEGYPVVTNFKGGPVEKK